MSDSKTGQDLEPANHTLVCPWWMCFTFDNILRRWLQNPERILKPYVRTGATVLDVGPGMGYFTIPLARLVGDGGKVIAADLQKKMLEAVNQRALRAGVQQRIQLQQCTPDRIGVSENLDFCLAFWMVHEVPDKARFLTEIAGRLKKTGLFLLAEPRIHVSGKAFKETLGIARKAGFAVVERPGIFLSYAVLLKKG